MNVWLAVLTCLYSANSAQLLLTKTLTPPKNWVIPAVTVRRFPPELSSVLLLPAPAPRYGYHVPYGLSELTPNGRRTTTLNAAAVVWASDAARVPTWETGNVPTRPVRITCCSFVFVRSRVTSRPRPKSIPVAPRRVVFQASSLPPNDVPLSSFTSCAVRTELTDESLILTSVFEYQTLAPNKEAEKSQLGCASTSPGTAIRQTTVNASSVFFMLPPSRYNKDGLTQEKLRGQLADPLHA